MWRRLLALLGLLAAVLLARPTPQAPPAPVATISASPSPVASPAPIQSTLVDVQQLAPSIRLDMRYASTNNFVNRQLYPVAKCLLRPEVAQQLAKVQADLERQGLGLLMLDCYRPLSAQKALWEIKPDPNYVADPSRGSNHNRAAAVDLTLVDKSGTQLEMPTEFDDFSPRTHPPDHPGASPAAIANSKKLRDAMTTHGFTPNSTEWWHFDGVNARDYDVLDLPLN